MRRKAHGATLPICLLASACALHVGDGASSPSPNPPHAPPISSPAPAPGPAPAPAPAPFGAASPGTHAVAPAASPVAAAPLVPAPLATKQVAHLNPAIYAAADA